MFGLELGNLANYFFQRVRYAKSSVTTSKMDREYSLASLMNRSRDTSIIFKILKSWVGNGSWEEKEI